MKLTAYGKTDVGLMRCNNEDSFYLDEKLGLFIVADGMGGHAAGEIASNMAVEAIRDLFATPLSKQASGDRLQALLADATNQANRAISRAGIEHPPWAGMGTTLTILLFCGQQALLTHVGDSRLYRWSNQQLEQLSDDHTLIADQLRRGAISHEESDKSNLRNILLQAVGVSEKLDICQKNLPAREGDCFLLCSDGLTDMLSQEKISAILADNPPPQLGCEELIAQALAAGGKDNVTAVLVKVDKL